MNTAKLANIVESILFVSGKEVGEKDITEKLSVTQLELNKAIGILKEKYSGACGITLLEFNGKLQFSSNSDYVNEVSLVLNPIREKELTKAMLETLAIIAYKQPLTRLEVEEMRGVDCTYAIGNLSKLNMIEIVGRKDTIGKPLLFGTTDEFLKRFDLEGLEQLPNYDELLERIKEISVIGQTETLQGDFYNSNRDKNFNVEEGDLPDFLKDESDVVVVD